MAVMIGVDPHRGSHTAVLKVWSNRHRDLARAGNQVACRRHAVLCELVPGGRTSWALPRYPRLRSVGYQGPRTYRPAPFGIFPRGSMRMPLLSTQNPG
jgi:hypothetical protein